MLTILAFVGTGIAFGVGVGKWAMLGLENWVGKGVEIDGRIGEGEVWKNWARLGGYWGGVGGGVRSRVHESYGGEREGVECDYHDYEGGVGKGKVVKRRERPVVRAFEGVPERFPEPVFGGYEELGLEGGVCFERFGRMGAYGFGYKVEEGGLGVGLSGLDEVERGGKLPLQKIDWRGIDWGEVQGRCVEKNQARFAVGGEGMGSPLGGRNDGGSGIVKGKVKRTAFLLRTWDDYEYTSSDIINLRSIISELSINTAGEYSIHLLVHVKSPVPIWSDSATYTEHLHRSVPREFWGIATLWNEPLMALVYSSLPPNEFRGLPVHGVYRSSFMPVQWFALNHPEYDFFWNWEMDVRYSGHLWEFLEKLNIWAKRQPRRGLWERNERFWIPAAHGPWGNFTQLVSKQVPLGETIWGPIPVPGVVLSPDDPTPPYPIEQDLAKPPSAQWGVNEDVDLLVLNPLFNPENTTWLLAEDTTGYPTQPPRRAAIIATSRLSRRLLLRMHAENAHHGHSAFTEMWPATCALHHGLKAVYVPHPVFIDRRWPLWYLERTFNHGPRGATGGAKESVFGEREHNFGGVSWYYNSGFAPEVWRRWVFGVKGEEEGGGEKKGSGSGGDRDGRVCLRGMLLHPVKRVDDLP